MIPSRNLIIKLGALGDVLRTTVLLSALGPDIYWAAEKQSIPLLPAGNCSLKQIVDINNAENTLSNIDFDLVISLDDDPRAARLAASVTKKTITGSFLDARGRITYSESSAQWFDMGLISRFGREEANRLKKHNAKSYQEIIFRMIGKEFKGEEYAINFSGNLNNKVAKEILVGIEGRADGRWPTKQWNKYEQLAEVLYRDGLKVRFFQQRNTLVEYINDISECDLIITGDTLALHIALALKIKTVAIFTCTSPAEIYGYSRMLKVVSPALEKAFYSREYIKEAPDAVSIEDVYESVKKIL